MKLIARPHDEIQTNQILKGYVYTSTANNYNF